MTYYVAMASTNIDEINSIDFETSIQIERILKILSDTISHVEVALCIPLIMSDGCEILQDYFKPEEVVFIKDTYEKLNTKQPQTENSTADASVHLDMCLVLGLFLSSSKLVTLCRDTLVFDICPGGVNLLRSLEELRICVAERLKITPKVEAQRDAELRQRYQENIRNRREVEKLQEKLNKLTVETEQEIEEKKQLIKKQIDKIAALKAQCRETIKKKMDEAERQICWDIKNSEFRLDELQTRAKNAQYSREVQLKDHLNSEKDLRAKKYKVESQLVALLQKYDSDIGERQAMLEELTANYEEEKEQMARLQEEFDEQEEEYVNLMIEKQEYEQQVWDAKLYDIRCRIAARKIQRFWRAYLAATKAKSKKGKKGKKKK